MNDVDYYESQGFSRDEAKAQVAAERASTKLMMAFFRLFFGVLGRGGHELF